MILTFDPKTHTSLAHKEYEESAEFQAYWNAQLESNRLHEIAQFRNVRSPEFQSFRAARDEASRLLAICRTLPIHKQAFGW